MTIPVQLDTVALPNDVTLRAGVGGDYEAKVVNLYVDDCWRSYTISPPVLMHAHRPYVLTVPDRNGETAHVLALDN